MREKRKIGVSDFDGFAQIWAVVTKPDILCNRILIWIMKNYSLVRIDLVVVELFHGKTNFG